MIYTISLARPSHPVCILLRKNLIVQSKDSDKGPLCRKIILAKYQFREQKETDQLNFKLSIK